MFAPYSEIDAPELPAFWLGTAGFSREQQAIIEIALHHNAGLVADWRLGHLGEADAWLVHGVKCRAMADGELRVSPGSPAETALNLDMRVTDRPVAFATPIVDPSLEPRHTFDASSSASVRQVLAEFDSCLRFARAQFVLGAEVVERGAALRHGIFHLSYHDQLIAVLDFLHGEAALSPQLDPTEVQHAVWAKRPKGTRVLPEGFVPTTPAQLAWNYARRSEGNLLPPRYRNRTIFYRRSPRVPLSWLRDSHLRILKELSCDSASLAELVQRTGTASPQLDRDVACLFYAGAITTTHSKAASSAAALAYARHPLLTERAAAYLHEPADRTVPGVLLKDHPRA